MVNRYVVIDADVNDVIESRVTSQVDLAGSSLAVSSQVIISLHVFTPLVINLPVRITGGEAVQADGAAASQVIEALGTVDTGAAVRVTVAQGGLLAAAAHETPRCLVDERPTWRAAGAHPVQEADLAE